MKTFKNSLFALALLSVGVVACDGTDADSAAPTAGREDVLVSDPAAAPVGAPADVTPFLGAWEYSSGSVTSTCGSNVGTKEISTADGYVEITAGEQPGTIAVKDGACAFSASVSGSEAVAESGIPCPGFVGTPSIVYSLSGRTMQKRATSTVGGGKFGTICSTRENATLVGR
jgi:hypothetical protein